MELFFAGGPNNKIFIKFYERTGIKVNILKNYYELKDMDFKKEILSYRPYVEKIMLDSGAFSANNSLNSKEAEIIKLRYPFFLKQHNDFLKENIYRVFTYDIRFDKEGYLENFVLYLDLRDVYENICPVVHRYTELGENIEIDKYIPYNPPTIAIGQIVSKKSRERRTNKTNLPKLQETIDAIKLSKSDCHLLGITEFKALNTLQNYDTCDSSSWNEFAKSGNVAIFWPTDTNNIEPISLNVKFPQFLKDTDKKDSFYQLNDAYQARFFEEMKKELKIDESDFNNSSSTESLQLANLYYSVKMVEFLNTKNNQPLPPGADHNKPETKVNPATNENQNPFANANISTTQPTILPEFTK